MGHCVAYSAFEPCILVCCCHKRLRWRRRRLGRRLATAFRLWTADRIHSLFRVHACFRRAWQSRCGSCVQKIRSWKLSRIWRDRLANRDRGACLRPGSLPAFGAILQRPRRERNRGQGGTVPHRHRRHLRSSRLADARCVVRFAWAFGSPPRCIRRSAREWLGAIALSPEWRVSSRCREAIIYAEKQPGEWRIDLTSGLRPLPGLLMLLQSFTSISNGPGQFGHVSWTKLQPRLRTH
jgi:hypothetical protein